MAERISGLYYGPQENSFVSGKEVSRRLALSGELPRVETEIPIHKDWKYWDSRFRDRKDEYRESIQEPENNHIVVDFPNRTTLNFIGDLHVGSPYVNYDRIAQEAETIVNTPDSYVVAMGDWVDGFFFNPAQMQQMEQPPQQRQYMISLLEYFSSNNRLILSLSGDHDMWASKMGIDPYEEFSNRFNAHFMQGVGYMTANVGEAQYKISMAHRHGGFSIYNNAHSAMRLMREDAQGADILVTAHTHRKGYVRQAVKDFGGESRKVDFIVVGPYKSTDDYARKLGFSQQTPNEMFGSAVILEKDTKKVTYFDDILDASNDMVR